jgi:chromatin structure-remodeling complex subunit SFH1
VQIGTHHLVDHIEWDLLSPLTPEVFASKLCNELGLSGEALPLIAHAVHEELIKHKKDALEWGVIGGERDKNDDRSGGQGVTKDKTGLGPGWGRSHKDGRVPRTLKSAWRDWQDAEEFGTTFEVLSQEEVERREIERERASRYVSLSLFLYCICGLTRIFLSFPYPMQSFAP